jgi:probable FeS assembly SUF system protein SufT
MRRRLETVVVRRPVTVEMVPSGTQVELPPDTLAQITQALGSSFSLLVEGHMVRLRGADADAIGKEPPQPPTLPPEATVDDLRKLVWQTLKTCYDPEIPVDIVELGLIYACNVQPLDDGRAAVSIEMTLTAAGCGMGESLADEVREKIEALPRVASVQVDLVFDPPWDRSRMSEAAALALGI